MSWDRSRMESLKRVAHGSGAFTLGAMLLVGCDVSYPSSVWTDPTYDHAALSGGFQLLGTHVDAPCTDCHASGNYEPLFQASSGSDCQACHREDFEGQHGSQGYPDLCTFCHTPTEWDDGSFDHGVSSGGYELLGVHADLSCAACHAPDSFDPLFDPESAQDCVTCHLSIFPAAHTQRGFPRNCAFCHTPTDWTEAVVDHLALAGTFELLGIHRTLPCTFCHTAGTMEPFFDPLDASDCVTCHLSLYEAVHEGSGYPTTCVNCHTPTSWGNGEFDHPAISGGFELVGVHEELACTSCHDATTFAPLFNPVDADDCQTCHLADYEGEHGGTEYPLNCTLCHSPVTWSGGTFDHEVVSGGFALLGVHAEKPCTSCHDATTFAPLFNPADADDCQTCHLADYEGEHGGTQYPLNCTLCHSPVSWSGGTFDHEVVSGGFALLGVHAEEPCTACHDATTFAPLFNPVDADDCQTCHLADYISQHDSEGYPTDCLSCHTPTAWEDADFDHDADYFPIFTGKHAPRWNSCSICHADPDDFSDFTCFACHSENSTNNKHDEEPGYTYVSSACLACHPDGTADD